MLAAPTRRQRRSDIAAMAGAALAVALAAAALITLIHRPPPRDLVATLSGPAGQATCSAAFSPDRATLAVADCNDSVYLWDVVTRRWIATLASPHCPDARQVVFRPDGKTLAVFGGLSPTVCLWDVAARRETTLTDPGPRAHLYYDGTAGAFSPSGTTLDVADANGNIYLWDLATRRVTATVPASSDCSPACPVAFSPDGTTLAVGESDGGGEHIYLWDLATRARSSRVFSRRGNASRPWRGRGMSRPTLRERVGVLAVGRFHGPV